MFSERTCLSYLNRSIFSSQTCFKWAFLATCILISACAGLKSWFQWINASCLQYCCWGGCWRKAVELSHWVVQADYKSVALAMVTSQTLTNKTNHLEHNSVLWKISTHVTVRKACLDSCQQSHIAQVAANKSSEEICNLFCGYPQRHCLCQWKNIVCETAFWILLMPSVAHQCLLFAKDKK